MLENIALLFFNILLEILITIHMNAFENFSTCSMIQNA